MSLDSADGYRFVQVMITRKGEKPPVWRKAYVPYDVSFAMMALILETITEQKPSEYYSFRFLHEKTYFMETDEDGLPLFLLNDSYRYLDAEDLCLSDFSLGEKSWFSFQILDGPEYRVDLESGAAPVTLPRGRGSLAWPVIIKERKSEDDPLWSGKDEVNQRLRQWCTLNDRIDEYWDFEERLESVLRGEGLGIGDFLCDEEDESSDNDNDFFDILSSLLSEGNDRDDDEGEWDNVYGRDDDDEEDWDDDEDDWDDEDGNFPSRDAYCKIIQMTNREKSLPATGQKEQSSRGKKSTMEDCLGMLDTEAIHDIVKDLELSPKGKTRADLLKTISQEFLKPDRMQFALLMESEEGLALFEEVAHSRYPVEMSEEDMDLLLSCGCPYLHLYEDGSLEVPEDAAEVFDGLLEEGFKEYHRRNAWLYRCLTYFDAFYLLAPVRVLYQMYRLRGAQLSLKQFETLLDDFNKKWGDHVLKDGIVGTGEMLEELERDDFVDLAGKARDFALPIDEEIDEYFVYRYPYSREEYRNFSNFLNTKLQLDLDDCNNICMLTCMNFSQGVAGVAEFMDFVLSELSSRGIRAIDRKKKKEMEDLLTEVNYATRKFMLNGSTIKETGCYEAASLADLLASLDETPEE